MEGLPSGEVARSIEPPGCGRTAPEKSERPDEDSCPVRAQPCPSASVSLASQVVGGVFISYRRDDSAPYAGRLGDALSRSFGAGEIFRDIDRIKPGERF